MKKPSSSPLDLALKFLSFRPRSEAEVVSYLKRKRVPLADISSTVTKLKDLDFVNDQTFASWWQETRARTAPRSARLLQVELRQKGISRDVISQVIDTSHDTEVARARQALNAKRHSSNPAQFLARRGFSWDIISLIITKNHGTID